MNLINIFYRQIDSSANGRISLLSARYSVCFFLVFVVFEIKFINE